MKYRIFVPSKGRPGKASTVRLLKKHNVQFTLVVEPQELGLYGDAYPDELMLSLPKNDMGLGYARKFICDQVATPKVWQLDDDLQSFVHLSDETDSIETIGPVEFFTTIEEYVDTYEAANQVVISNAGAQYSQACRNPNAKWVTLNRHVGTCFLSATCKVLPFDPSFKVRQDIDFNLRNIVAGFPTLKFNKLGFRCATLAGNPGGCQPFYHQGISTHYATMVAERYPDFVELRSVDDSLDRRLRVNWREVDKRFGTLKGTV